MKCKWCEKEFEQVGKTAICKDCLEHAMKLFEAKEDYLKFHILEETRNES